MLRNSRLRWLLGLLAALALVAAACGDDSSSGDDGGDDTADSASAVPACLDIPALYALTGPESTGFANWSDAADLATTVGSAYSADLPDEPLTITGPGEESGTYDTYVEFVIAGIAEEQGLPEEEAVVRPDYTSSPNDNVIIEGVAGADNSYGWVGFAFAEENSDVVREIEVAGEDGTCVAPSVDTIADGSYPLSRPLFIYVNADKAAENPALAAFVDYYTGDAGYAGRLGRRLRADARRGLRSGHRGLGRRRRHARGARVRCLRRGRHLRLLDRGAHQLRRGRGLQRRQPGREHLGRRPGTGDGFELFCGGETDISDASRPIEDDEIAACEDAGINYIEIQIGLDGLSILTKA